MAGGWVDLTSAHPPVLSKKKGVSSMNVIAATLVALSLAFCFGVHVYLWFFLRTIHQRLTALSALCDQLNGEYQRLYDDYKLTERMGEDHSSTTVH
jgi:hypothetical protein